MNNQLLKKVFLMTCLSLWSLASHAVGGITSDNAKPHYSRFTNEEAFEDMRVKVLGGYVRMTRQWNGKSWEWNDRWQDLEFHETGHLADAVGVWYSDPSMYEGGQNPQKAVENKPPLFVLRAGQAYRRVPDDTKVIYENQLRNFITRTDSGYHWRDSKGNGIDYDIYGRLISYNDRNNVMVYVDRDANGYITQIRDHHRAQVIAYTWEAIPGAGTRRNVNGDTYTPQRLVKLTDYAGRSVTYHWNDNNQLSHITDVLGEEWQFIYGDEGELAQQIDPEGRITRYDIELNGQLNSRINHDGVGVSYSYNYDQENDIYFVTEKYTSGRVVETAYNAMGQEQRSAINGDTQRSSSVILSDNSPGVSNLVKGYSTRRIHWYRGSRLVRTETSAPALPNVDTTPLYIKNDIQTDARGNKTHYEYDQWKNVVKVTYPDGSSIKNTWNNELSLPLTRTNEKGVMTKYEYDDRGNLLTLVEANGKPEERPTRYTYDEYGQMLTETTGESPADDTELATTQYEYDNYGNISRIVDPMGNVTQLKGYDALGNAQIIIDGRANELPVEEQYTWMRSYDAAGNLLSDLNPYGQGNTYSYNRAGDLKAATAANDSITKITNNASGLPLTITDANEQTARLEYDRDGRPAVVIDQNGNTTRFDYNNQGRLSKLTDGEGNATQYEYANTLLASIHYPTYKEVLEYDSRNRVKEITQKTNSREYLRKLGYDITSNLSGKVDANGNSDVYEYDALNRLTKITDSSGGETRFTYDARDNLIRVQDPEGRLTVYSYTQNDQQFSETKHDYLGTDKQRVYDYDANGNLIAVTNPEQEKTAFEYDRANRLLKTAVYANKSDTHPIKVVNYHINDKNQLTGYSQTAGTDGEGNIHPKATADTLPLSETYTYTTLNQVESVAVDFGVFQKTYSYTYYPNGLKKTYTNPEGITYTYYYNKNNELAAVHIPGSGQLSYTNFQWLVPQTLVLPGGSKITLAYNDFLQVEQRILKDPANNDIAQALYEYDLERNITSIATEHGSYLFGYDSQYRLTGADYPESVAANDESFGYDGVGNRTTHGTGGGEDETIVAATYGNQNQLLGNDQSANFTYNANGHTVSKTVGGVTTEYIYNSEERLVEVKQGGERVGQYAYNPYGQRIRKIAGGTTTYFLYNDEGLAAEYDSAGTLLKEYHFKPYNPWMTDPLFQRSAAGDVYYYQNDHLGTPQRMLAANGAVVWEARYEAFGEATVVTDQVGNNLRFPGQYFDGETGLHHNYFRDYDPGVGRYVQSDPIGLGAGLNWYVYGNQNPVVWIDPDGKLPLVVLVPFISGMINGLMNAMSAAACGSNAPGQVFSAFAQGFVSGAIGATVGIGVSVVAGPVLGGAAVGVTSTVMTQAMQGNGFDTTSIGVNAMVGAATGGIAPRMFPTRGRMPSWLKNRNEKNFGPNSYRIMGQNAVGSFATGYANHGGLAHSVIDGGGGNVCGCYR